MDSLRPSLESIVCAPAPRWKYRGRTVFMEFFAGLPACIGLGIAFNLWRPHAEPIAIGVVVLGFLATLAGIMLLRRWNRQEATWRRSELLTHARRYGYSEDEVVAYEDQLAQEETDFEENPAR
jgi:hypothetical protein